MFKLLIMFFKSSIELAELMLNIPSEIVLTSTFFLEVYSEMNPPRAIIEIITKINKITNTGIDRLCEITSKVPVKYSLPGIVEFINNHHFYLKRLSPFLFKNIPTITKSTTNTIHAIIVFGEDKESPSDPFERIFTIFGITIEDNKK